MKWYAYSWHSIVTQTLVSVVLKLENERCGLLAMQVL